MQNLNYLFVEGKDDFHVLKNLLKKHEIETGTFTVPHNRRVPNKIYLNGLGDDQHTGKGIDNLKQAVRNVLQLDYTVKSLGIIVDADSAPLSRWDALCSLARQAGVGNFPAEVVYDGYVTILNRVNKPSLKIGFWIMPDNLHTGMLEHFVSAMIAPQNFLWDKAVRDVQAIPSNQRLFPNRHTRKAEIHTWLAWQETPGKPMGIGVTAGYFDHQSPIALAFVQWIKTLFDV